MEDHLLEKLKEFNVPEEVLAEVSEIKKSSDNFREKFEEQRELKRRVTDELNESAKLLKQVKNTLGVDELTVEAIEGLTTQQTDNKEFETEKRKLEAQLKALEEEALTYKTKTEELSGLTKKQALQVEAYKLGIKNNLVSDKAAEVVMAELQKGYNVDENGKGYYVDKNNNIALNKRGEELSISDKFETLLNDDDYSFLFKPRTESGGESTRSQGFKSNAIRREDFDRLAPRKQMEFIENGGAIT